MVNTELIWYIHVLIKEMSLNLRHPKTNAKSLFENWNRENIYETIYNFLEYSKK